MKQPKAFRPIAFAVEDYLKRSANSKESVKLTTVDTLNRVGTVIIYQGELWSAHDHRGAGEPALIRLMNKRVSLEVEPLSELDRGPRTITERRFVLFMRASFESQAALDTTVEPPTLVWQSKPGETVTSSGQVHSGDAAPKPTRSLPLLERVPRLVRNEATHHEVAPRIAPQALTEVTSAQALESATPASPSHSRNTPPPTSPSAVTPNTLSPNTLSPYTLSPNALSSSTLSPSSKTPNTLTPNTLRPLALDTELEVAPTRNSQHDARLPNSVNAPLHRRWKTALEVAAIVVLASSVAVFANVRSSASHHVEKAVKTSSNPVGAAQALEQVQAPQPEVGRTPLSVDQHALIGSQPPAATPAIPPPKPETSLAPSAVAVHVRSVSSSAALGAVDLSKYVYSTIGQFGECYDWATARAGRDALGKVMVTVRLTAEGAVGSSHATGGKIQGLNRCVADVGARLPALMPLPKAENTLTWVVVFER